MITASQETGSLLAPMIKKTLWVVLSTAQASSSQMEPHAPKHLRYMNDLERKGLLWGSGPFIIPGIAVGDGLTIFDVSDEAEVHRLMADEPLTKLGMRTYTVRKWELREGRISIDLYLSQSRVALG
jgi:uncharacterized protein YciI